MEEESEDSGIEQESRTRPNKRRPHEPHRVRLPGFLIEEEIGLGDALKRVTYKMGIQPCAGCEKRAAALNRRIHFTR